MFRRTLVAAGLLLAATAPLQAQVPVIDIRVGAHLASPTGDFKNGFNSGFGAYGRLGIPVGTFKLMGALTWNRFAPVTSGGADQDIITVQAGPHFFLVPLVDIGVEGAYISEIEEFGISPSVSVGFSKLEISASYTTSFASPATNWLTIGAGFRF